MYTAAQGGQYIALSYLPSNHVSLFMNFSPVFVSLIGILVLGEKLTILKGSGGSDIHSRNKHIFSPAHRSRRKDYRLYCSIGMFYLPYNSIPDRKIPEQITKSLPHGNYCCDNVYRGNTVIYNWNSS